MSEANHRLKLNYNREPRQTARTRNDGRKSMHGSTDTAQLTRCSSTLSGMSTAASSATTYCCSSDAQHQVSEKGFKGRLGHSIQPLQKLPQCELPSSVSSSNKPRPRRGLGRVFQSDSDSKVLHKSKKLAKPQRHESASNVPDPTNRDSFRRDRSSSAIEMLYKPRGPSVSRETDKPQPCQVLGRVFQSDSDWKVHHKVGTTKLSKLKRHLSVSNFPDPTSNDSFRRSGSGGAFELPHRPKSQSMSCGSAFDAQAIASNMRLWGNGQWGLAVQNTKLSNRRAKHRPNSLPAASHENLYPSSSICTARTTTMIKRCFLGLVGCLYTCFSPVVLLLASFVAACLSSDPPWAAPSPVSGRAEPGRAERRRPSTVDTCQWAFEALTFDYDFYL